jgi:hypothetical protein
MEFANIALFNFDETKFARLTLFLRTLPKVAENLG